jgi:hypothetical protein
MNLRLLCVAADGRPLLNFNRRMYRSRRKKRQNVVYTKSYTKRLQGESCQWLTLAVQLLLWQYAFSDNHMRTTCLFSIIS